MVSEAGRGYDLLFIGWTACLESKLLHELSNLSIDANLYLAVNLSNDKVFIFIIQLLLISICGEAAEETLEERKSGL